MLPGVSHRDHCKSDNPVPFLVLWLIPPPTSLHYPRSYAAARLSQTVKDAQGHEDDDTVPPEDVEILKVESACLEKVVEFLKHHEIEPMTEITTPLSENTFEGVVKQEWYLEFIKGLDQSMIFDLVTAANFMAIQPLLDIACLKVSCTLMGKTAEEIRVMLNIPKMTPAEEAKAREEHRWIFDD